MKVSHSSRIIGFRNQLIHVYASISDEVVWEAVEMYLPVLHREVAALLNSAEPI